MDISYPCDVVLLPDKDLSNHAILTSLLIGHDNDVLFNLEEGKFWPHISIYMFQLKQADIPLVDEILDSLAKQFKTFDLSAIKFGNEEKFFDIEYQKTIEIELLQNAVVNGINPIRNGMREKDKERMKTATGLAKHNFASYGYKYIGDLFRPHLTITRFSELKSYIPPVDLGSVHEYSGTFNKIGLFKTGDNGTAVAEIASYELKDSSD